MILKSPAKSDIGAWLHQEMIAKGGGLFIPADDWWRPDPTAQSANIAEAKCSVTEAMRPWLTAALAYYAKENAARTLKQLSYILRRCAVSGLDVLSEADAVAIRNSLLKSEFAVLRAFLKKWRESYLLEVSPSEDVIETLYSLKPLKALGPCPVESMDPMKGPFTVRETKSIFDWVNDAFSAKRISLEKIVYIRLLITTGARSRQLQQLVFGDIGKVGDIVKIRVPKAKQKSFGYRDSFQDLELPRDLYALLEGYKRKSLDRLEAENPGINWKKALPNVPIFRAKGRAGPYVEIIDDPDLHFLEEFPVEKFHKNDGSMRALLRDLEKDPKFPISERTGKPIHLGAHRFRYTLGTDMSRMGSGPHAIASALGHKWVGSVTRYIKVSPEMGRRIDDKMKPKIALVINAFKGKVVADATEAVNGSHPNKMIRAKTSAIATCGASSGCHLDAPVACYTCSKFQPWVEGPHHEVLERLRLRQKRAIEKDGIDSAAAISFDEPILAVMQVINLVNSKNSHSGDQSDG